MTAPVIVLVSFLWILVVWKGVISKAPRDPSPGAPLKSIVKTKKQFCNDYDILMAKITLSAGL